MLIVLILIENNILIEPIIYPSYFFKKHQQEYYFTLDRVRTHGDFEGWMQFYLEAICESAKDAYSRTTEIEELKNKLNGPFALPRPAEKMSKALSIIFEFPIIDVQKLASQLRVSYNTANSIINRFVDLKILEPINKAQRNRLFKFKKYWELLEKEY